MNGKKEEKFCKVFEIADGQIVAMLTSNDGGDPSVAFFCQPPGLGVCKIAANYTDTDEGWNSAEKYFAELTEAQAQTAVKALFEMLEAKVD